MTDLKRPAVPVLRFLGAAETVTGSRFLIDTPGALGLGEYCGRGVRAEPVAGCTRGIARLF